MDGIANFLMTVHIMEIPVNHMVQQSFQSLEFFWVELSAYFSVAQLMDIFVPFVGIFHHQLLVRLVCSLGFINALNSVIKWTYPEYRPYWWVREYPKLSNFSSLRQHYLTCETTAGFPSSHNMAFTAFVHLVTVFTFSSLFRRFNINLKHLEPVCLALVSISSICMWLSRVYLGCQFLHQCIVASIASIFLLHFFDRYSTFFYTLSLRASILLVLSASLIPISVYFTMQQLDLDPHWSVRMAFKWCSDPSYLRHEASPIFTLARDFGYLMGVALSAPLYKRYECEELLSKRIPTILVLELVNWFARYCVPKQRGRFIFVAYEFLRNTLHSYTLLSVISII